MSNILTQTQKQSLVFNKKNFVVAVSHYKNDVLINTYFLNVGFFRNIQKTMMHFRDALTRIKAYHDKDLFRLFPEMRPVNPPIVTTDNKLDIAKGESLGVVISEGDALSQQFKQALAHCSTCLDLPSFMRCKDACSLSKDDPQVSPFIDDDIPDFGLGF